MRVVRVATAVFISIFGATFASRGDQQEEYQACLRQCISSENCALNRYTTNQSLLNRLLLWDCHSECRYRCMWETESKNRSIGQLPVYQYYGKWPFKRILGTQELASVLFSLGNLLAHYYGYCHIYKGATRLSPKRWFLHEVIGANFYISTNAWFWSIIFHIRDFELTQKLDYFSAIALLFVSAYLAVLRAFSVHGWRRQLGIGVPLLLLYFNHLRYMLLVHFDFSWNMKVAIASGLTFLLLFIIWSVLHLAKGKRPHTKHALAACLLGMAAALLEVNDFPPIWNLIDAHALWHAATIPVVLLWYVFYREDALYDLGLRPLIHGKLVD